MCVSVRVQKHLWMGAEYAFWGHACASWQALAQRAGVKSNAKIQVQASPTCIPERVLESWMSQDISDVEVGGKGPHLVCAPPLTCLKPQHPTFFIPPYLVLHRVYILNTYYLSGPLLRTIDSDMNKKKIKNCCPQGIYRLVLEDLQTD